MLIISPNPVPRIHGAALSETNHFFSHRLQNPLPSQASSKSSKWQRSTILSATDCRIHYHPKPGNILPRHSPTKPQGRTDRGEPFLLPPIAESTTIPRQLRTFPCIVPRSHRAERNHFFSHRLLHPLPSEKPVLPTTCNPYRRNQRQRGTIVSAQWIISPHTVPRIHGAEMRDMNHFFSHRLQNPLPSQASLKSSKWRRATILSATDCRIHYHLKPVHMRRANLPSDRDQPFCQPLLAESTTTPSQLIIFPDIVPRRTGKEEPFLLPPFTESTTIPSQFRTFPCIVPQNPKAAMNHWFTHRLLPPLPS